MSLFGFALVFAAAFCHAIWNFFVKRINGGPELIWLFSAVSVAVYFPLASWILIYQTISSDFLQLLFIVGSVIIHLGYFILLQIGYGNGDLSLVYPVARATGPILSTCLAVLFLEETISMLMVTGAGLIIFGVFNLTRRSRHKTQYALPSIFFGLGAGGLIGLYTVWDAYAVSFFLIPPLLLDYASAIGRTIILAPIAIKHKALLKRHWKQNRVGVIVVGIFNPLAYILVLYALTFTPVAYVAPIRETSVVLTVLAGSLLLKEGYLKQRLSWAVVILVGLAILVSSGR